MEESLEGMRERQRIAINRRTGATGWTEDAVLSLERPMFLAGLTSIEMRTSTSIIQTFIALSPSKRLRMSFMRRMRTFTVECFTSASNHRAWRIAAMLALITSADTEQHTDTELLSMRLLTVQVWLKQMGVLRQNCDQQADHRGTRPVDVTSVLARTVTED